MSFKNENPLVSIISPLFNRDRLISFTIESVSNQSYKNWEYLIVDDGSTDTSLAIVEQYKGKDERIKLIKRQRQPKGAPVCRNIGLENASGELIIFLDSDDLLLVDCLLTRVEYFLKFAENDFLVFQTVEFNHHIWDTNILINYFYPTKNILDRFLTRDIPWLTSGPIWKKESIIKIKGWDENLSSSQDWELHIRAIAEGMKFRTFDIIDNCWRRPILKDSMTSTLTNDNRLNNYQLALNKVFFLFQEKGIIDESLKRKFSALYFSLAKEIVFQLNDYKIALNSWNITLENKLVSKNEFKIGTKALLIFSKINYNHTKGLRHIVLFIIDKVMSYILLPPFLKIKRSSFHKAKASNDLLN